MFLQGQAASCWALTAATGNTSMDYSTQNASVVRQEAAHSRFMFTGLVTFQSDRKQTSEVYFGRKVICVQ